jgi:hypothetical protein
MFIMALGSPLKGHNRLFTAPPGEEERVQAIEVFDNGSCLVTCWELSDEEIETIVKTKKIYASFWSRSLAPHYIGSESLVRMVISDFGSPLPKQE